ncbi:Alpha-SNAP [Hexamita inflata]|uniref:Gamma-soluble NSF attachment protein n=1 Tax=Hexamita inflata TaxID=28002 RepID=A0ABP1GWS9_9EUKA
MQDPQALVQQAEKELTKSLFHKPNPGAASILFSQASDVYRKRGDLNNAFVCCQRGADLNVEGEILTYLCQDMANLAAKLNKGAECKQYYIRASQQQQRVGKFGEAAQNLFMAAAYCEIEEAKTLLQQGFDIFKVENQDQRGVVCLMDLIESQINSKLLSQAMQLMDVARSVLFGKQEHAFKMDKLSLYSVVICLSLGDTVKLDEVFEYFGDFNGQHALFAQDLIKFYKEKDAFYFKETVNTYLTKLKLPQEIAALLRGIKIEGDLDL